MHVGLIGGIGPAATEFYYRGMTRAFAAAGRKLELTIVNAEVRDMTRTMADGGMLRLYSLTLDRVPVAMVHNLDVGGTLYMYNSGYDPAYSHYAVGLMSKAMLIQDAIESGRKAVDFMRGDESYKYDLGGKDRKVLRWC
jgi:CelD/BcsL family acetyltransferase involved in cellulose biosynthesis